jgi:uncharacterized surface protein with fasciclin (FAS1) repeats
MNSQQSSRSFVKTFGIALATASLLVNFPSFAGNPSASKPHDSMMHAGKANANTIVDVASKNRSFKTLVAAIKAAGLVETLSGKGPFTVLAPTDSAFNALPKGTLAKLLKLENKATLVKILTYHVHPGLITGQNVKAGDFNTVEGQPIKVQVKSNGDVLVNNATVTKADIKASNGVIHVIDKVLLPPGLKL